MKRFLFIPSCALLAFGMLTSCQKEDKSAQQLAEELTAELQKVTDYKTAEAVAPRVEALNKRFQNASVRVFSADANALVASEANAYSDALCRLVREVGRVQASKPVVEADGEVDDASLVCSVGVGAGASADSPAKDQFAKGQLYTFNAESESNNNPPAFAEYYGSAKLASALSYVASIDDNGAFKFASDEDVPAIPDAVEVERETMGAVSTMPATEEEEPAADEEAGEEPAAEDDLSADTGDVEEPAADEAVGEEPAAEDDLSADTGDEEGPTADAEMTEEPAADEETVTDDAAGEEEITDDAMGEDDLGGDAEIDLEL